VAAAGVDPSAQSAGAAMQTAPAVAGVPDTASGTLATPATSTALQPQTSTLDAGELPQRLGERLRWLIDDGVQEARLQLHPADLGSIDIRVRVDDVGTAHVWFAAEHPAARAALETALPQLRERFASDGLDLQSSAVSAQGRGWDSQGQSPSSARFAGVSATAVDDTAETVHSTAASSRSAVHDGLIDRYA
jgi:flagellar hook-length control protein FliK